MRPLYSIQVLRAVAAIAVVAAHAQGMAVRISMRSGVPNPLPDLVGGAAGVDLFFVISGFIMVHVAQFGSATGAQIFLLRRLIRIVPLYWFATTIVIAFWLFVRDMGFGDTTWRDVLASYAFMSTREGAAHQFAPLLGAGWTLNYEMFFYLLFAASVFLPRRSAVLTLCAALAGFALLGRYLPVPPALQYLTIDPNARPMFLEFVIGMVLGLAYCEGWRVPRVVAWCLVITGAAALVGAGAVMAKLGGVPTMITASGLIGFSSPRLVVWGIPAAMLMIGMLCVAEPRELSPGWRAAVLLGNASYAIYLLHGPVMFLQQVPHIRDACGLVARLPIFYTSLLIACSVAVGVAFHMAIEQPVTKWLRGLFGLRAYEDETARGLRAAVSIAPNMPAGLPGPR